MRAEKEREAGDGFDGTWVAHPDSVPVATEAFDAVLGERPNQVERRRDEVEVDAAELLAVAADARRGDRGRAALERERRASSTSRRGCAATARPGSTG